MYSLKLWNGTYLGEIQHIVNKIYYEINKTHYWTILYDNHYILGAIKQIENPINCIYDELLTLFNLAKMGTNYFKYKSKYYIIYRVNTRSNDNYRIIPDIPLSYIDINTLDNNYRREIRKIYIVRDMLGITHTADSDIIIRMPDKNISKSYMISMKTYSLNENIYFNNICTLTYTCKKKWFIEKKEDISIRDVYKEIFSDVKSVEDLTDYISHISTQIDKIIKRIDKKYCYISKLISHRLVNKLSLII